ncbi:hypothetical protein H261_02961 [Paramagnetospirillum caucaseum]|uniref:Uncharacterized protein n=1 Tax=Paramagnetospirillum caucaseum TaxID=1244869 RepID=M2ZW21_9PROT|nr:hypothetical protein H261_02961 [Paramagnetospirillum caucaseum]
MDAIQENESDSPDRQILFESAALAILTHVLESGTRIDLAVSEYLKQTSIGSDETHVRPDLIICVSDCLGLLHRAADGTPDDVRQVLDGATRAWRNADRTRRLSAQGGITRIQACIGNIRRAIGANS